MRSRRLTIAVALGLVAAAATAAILLNLALLGYAQPRNDPVGKLSPRAVLPSGAPAPQATTLGPPPRGPTPQTPASTTDGHGPDDGGRDD